MTTQQKTFTEDDRVRKGVFPTPPIWVEKSQEYLAKVFGKNWQDEYYVWDCCCGTGNLLVGLVNPYNIWASTIDQADWHVENCLHWMKDSGWNEDGHYSKHGQEMFVEMTNMALSLLRLMQKPDESVQELTEEVHFNPKMFLYLLGIA